MNRLFYLCAFVSLFYRFGNASPSGAPMKTCITMTPSKTKHGAGPQETDAPYTIKVDMKYYNESSTVEVIVKGKADGNTIGGFLIEAREEGKMKPLGRFTDIPEKTDHLDCTGTEFGANAAEHMWGAVTHSEEVARKMVTLKWKPNPMTTGNIYFVATIAQGRQTYWLRVKSVVLKHMTTDPDMGKPTPNNMTDTPSGGMKSTPTGNGGMKSTPTGNGAITNVANSIALLVLAITAKLFI